MTEINNKARTICPHRLVKLSDDPDVKPRVCLRCRETFLSLHAGNRLCGGCNRIVVEIRTGTMVGTEEVEAMI